MRRYGEAKLLWTYTPAGSFSLQLEATTHLQSSLRKQAPLQEVQHLPPWRKILSRPAHTAPVVYSPIRNLEINLRLHTTGPPTPYPPLPSPPLPRHFPSEIPKALLNPAPPTPFRNTLIHRPPTPPSRWEAAPIVETIYLLFSQRALASETTAEDSSTRIGTPLPPSL